MAGETPSGIFTIIADAKGTRTQSARAPPQLPPAAPIPYMAVPWAPVQAAEWPRPQGEQTPQEGSNETATLSPGVNSVTASPTAMTSPANSWPITKGPGNGA